MNPNAPLTQCADCQHSTSDGITTFCESPQVMVAHKRRAFSRHERDTLDIEHHRDTPEKQKCGPEAKNFKRRTA
jgi:hypothetical protein